MSIKIRSHWKLGFAVLAIVALCIATATFASFLSQQVCFSLKGTSDQYGHGAYGAGIITGDGFVSTTVKVYQYATILWGDAQFCVEMEA